MQNTNLFPRFIDRPRLIGAFEMDEFMLTFFTIMGMIGLSFLTPNLSSLVVMLGSIFTGIIVGISYKKYKRNKPDGYTIHKLYAKGIFHPQDNKIYEVSHPYLKKYRIVPFGFTRILIN